MDIAAKLTSKGQITVPKSVRNALHLEPGDNVIFRLVDDHAILARTANFLDLAGSIPVPPAKRGADWDEVRHSTRRSLGKARS